MVIEASNSPYQAVSGNQLAEFIPASLSGGRFNNSHDLAMISIGSHEKTDCFRFNLYNLSLGCPLENQLCEFELVGMRYNNATQRAERTDIVRTVEAEACGQDRCDLTTTNFDGYQNITAFIIKATANNDTQTWWADNLVVGWTDTSCEAVQCREQAANLTGKPVLNRWFRF
jgi:hypothetical protein